MVAKLTMLLGSLDHTPSEQLQDDLSQWHTTALVLSEGGEHWHQLPQDLASRFGPRGKLLKWSGRNRASYREKFERNIWDCLSGYPVHVRVVSAQGKTIKEFFPAILSDLRITDIVRQSSSGTKVYFEFGPFARASYGYPPVPWTCRLPERQAIPLLFICHFLLRTHRSVLSMIQADQPSIDWIDWQLMYNKFPGDVHGAMNSLFSAIMKSSARSGAISGNMLLGTFNNAKTDRGNILTDNIAGLFADKLKRGELEVHEPPNNRKGSSMFWEIWKRST